MSVDVVRTAPPQHRASAGRDVISRFRGEDEFLSNFSDHPVRWRDITFPTAEAAFHAGKTLDPTVRARIAAAPSPGKAKQLGRTLALRPGWDDHVRHTVMREVLAAKFTDPDLAARLAETGTAQVSGPLLPHLFQRRLGWQWKVPSHSTILALLAQTLARTGLKDTAGETLHYTPHDFRRIFATEAVTGGLPVHIVARILGHANISTTQAYMAVFDEELVRTYRAFLDKRRALRPAAEYREPTTEEWREFQQHFELRKVSLGDCGRPYATPCQHEHACVRCPMLRVSPRQRPRLVEIAGNLRERITEARINGWLGEVQGLQVSLDAAHNKLASLDRSLMRMDLAHRSGITDLGIPTIGPL